MERTKENKTIIKMVWAARIAFFLSLVVLALKFYAYNETKSMAVLSDALESIVNVISSLVAWMVIRAVAEPADENHPYGHGKLEYFSAAFEGGLIAFAALLIAYEASLSLYKGTFLNKLQSGMIYIGIAAVINFILGMSLVYFSKQNKIESLLASGYHILSDVWTTVGVLIGLLLVYVTGWNWLDPLVALLVAFQLGYMGWKITRGAIGALIDEVDIKVVQELAVAFEKNRESGLIDFHHLKLIRSGRFHHVDVHIVVPEFWDISKGHQITNSFEERVVASYPYDGEIAFHLDPCGREFCSRCDVKNCHLRKRDFVAQSTFTPEQLIQGPKKDSDVYRK